MSSEADISGVVTATLLGEPHTPIEYSLARDVVIAQARLWDATRALEEATAVDRDTRTWSDRTSDAVGKLIEWCATAEVEEIEKAPNSDFDELLGRAKQP